MTPLDALGLDWIREENGFYLVRASLEEDVEFEILSSLHVIEDHGGASRNTRKLVEVSLKDGGSARKFLQTKVYSKQTGRNYEIIKVIENSDGKLATINLHNNPITIKEFFPNYKKGEDLKIRVLREYEYAA